jgi:hypothetical protein
MIDALAVTCPEVVRKLSIRWPNSGQHTTPYRGGWPFGRKVGRRVYLITPLVGGWS